ncbi:MAG: glycosyltransferase [Cellulosilyticum sp.]|nr:glycosyltransferase [Cellulosilyticum sp.]
MMIQKYKKVSVIVPAYNISGYIEECLESLLQQTYSNFEVIIIDDGSTDDTWDKIQYYVGIDNRFKAYKQKNQGASVARNYALDIISGEYCMFVDSDDFIEKDTIAKIVDSIETSNAEWVNYQFNRIDINNNRIPSKDYAEGFKDISDDEKKFLFIRDVLAEYLVGYEVWGKLYKTEIISKNKIRFDKSIKIGEDLAFNMTYALYANSIKCIDDKLYCYRMRSDSVMATNDDILIQVEERLKVLENIRKEYKNEFNEYFSERFYQIYLKLFFYSCSGMMVEECVDIAGKINDKNFLAYCKMAVNNKKNFYKYSIYELPVIYWKYVYYIQTRLNNDIKGKIYFALYDIYCKIRGMKTIDKWII